MTLIFDCSPPLRQLKRVHLGQQQTNKHTNKQAIYSVYVKTRSLSRSWGLCYKLPTACQCTCVRTPGSSLMQGDMCDQCCDIEMFTCGTKGQKQKTALIVSPRFHLLHVASPHRAATVYYFLHADTVHSDTTNVAHTNLLFRVVFFFLLGVYRRFFFFFMKSSLLTINSPSWSDYFQTVQQS